MRSGQANQGVQGNVEFNAAIQALRLRYPVLNADPRIAGLSPIDMANTLLNSLGVEKNLLDTFAARVREYAEQNFNQSGKSYTVAEVNLGNTNIVAPARTKVKPERMRAVNLLLEMLTEGCAQQIYDYVRTPQFLALSGCNETKLNFTRTHLADHVKPFIKGYEQFLSQSSNEYLIKALSHPIIANLSPDNWAMFFWQYNPKLIADFLVNVYRIHDINASVNMGCTVNVELLQGVLNNDPVVIERVNEVLAKSRASLLLPADVLSPGKNTLLEESLEASQLYQYEDVAIAAIESWMYQKYQHLLLNNIKSDNLTTNLDANAPYYFYLVSASQYMLLDPDKRNSAHASRFNQFRNDIRQLVHSAEGSAKPVIFCGLINIDNVHYLPYFITKNQQNLVSVVTLDPSPRVYSDATLMNSKGKLEDSKVKMHELLKKIFTHIFPNCHFQDPDIAQMLRERDCGPNAATTLVDAFETCISDDPLLTLRPVTGMALSSNKLTVKGVPVGTNPYNHMLVYPAALDTASLESRAMWEQRLLAIDKVYPLMRSASDHAMSINDVYAIDENFFEEFDFKSCVANQVHQDGRSGKLSELRSTLLASNIGNDLLNELIAIYHRDLRLPSPKLLISFLKSNLSNDALRQLTEAHDGNLNVLCDEFIVVLLKDRFRSVMLHAFHSKVLNHLPDKFNLDPQQLVENFFKTNQEVISRLTSYQHNQIKSALLAAASAAVMDKFSQLHMRNIENYFKMAINVVLCELPRNVNLPLAPHILQTFVTNNPGLRDSIEFMQAHHPHALNHYIEDHAMVVVRGIKQATVQYVADWFVDVCKSENNFMKFYTPAGEFIEYQLDELTKILPVSSLPILSCDHVNSFIGAQVVDAVNAKLSVLARRIMQAFCAERSARFLASPLVTAVLMDGHTIQSLISIVHNMRQENVLQQLHGKIVDCANRFGSAESITAEMLDNPVSGPFLTSILSRALHQFYRANLNNRFVAVRNEILANTPAIRFFYDIAQFADGCDSILLQLLTRYASSDAYAKMPPEFACIFDSTKAADGLNAGLIFANWFTAETEFNFSANFAKLQSLQGKVIQTSQLVTEFIQRLTDAEIRFPEQAFSVLQQSLTECNDSINATHLYENVAENFVLLNARLSELQHSMIKTFSNHKFYKQGDISPEQYTAIVRPLLCQLLGFQDFSILTKQLAGMVDTQIQAAINQLQTGGVLNVLNHRSLEMMPALKAIPDTYGKPLTRDMLINLIGYWQTQSKGAEEPELVCYLIKLVNMRLFDEDEMLPPDIAAKLRRLLFSKQDNIALAAIYSSQDLLDVIKKSLMRTSTFSAMGRSEIRFSSLVRLLKLPVQAVAAVVREPNQHEFQMKFRQLREAYRSKHVLDDDAVLPTAVLENLMKEARDMLRGGVAATAVITALQFEPAALVRSTGFFSTSFFAEGLSAVEKLLLHLKEKHAPQPDFNLDEDDISLLCHQLKIEWQALVAALGGEEQAYCHYVLNPRRSDRVNIALAELLAIQLRNKGDLQYVYTLLMPGYNRFIQPSALKSQTLSNAALIMLGRAEDKASCVDDIPFCDLIITQSGYALNYTAIINDFISNSSLVNPYTNALYTHNELADICRHPRAPELAERIKSKNSEKDFTVPIECLVRYLNEAIYTFGFGAYYLPHMNYFADNAYIKFMKEITELPNKLGEQFLQVKIPCEDKNTIQSIFGSSQNSCLTYNGIYLARVVIAYKGNNHGLTNRSLFERANEKYIPRIQKAGDAPTPMALAEAHIVQLCANRKPPVINRKY